MQALDCSFERMRSEFEADGRGRNDQQRLVGFYLLLVAFNLTRNFILLRHLIPCDWNLMVSRSESLMVRMNISG